MEVGWIAKQCHGGIAIGRLLHIPFSSIVLRCFIVYDGRCLCGADFGARIGLGGRCFTHIGRVFYTRRQREVLSYGSMQEVLWLHIQGEREDAFILSPREGAQTLLFHSDLAMKT